MAGPVPELLLPDTDDPEHAAFWDGCARGSLLMQACDDCGRWRMPPRPMCPHCHSTRIRWDETNGRGRIWSFAVPHPPLLPAYSSLAPYNVLVVELDQDPSIRVVGNLVAAEDAPINSVDTSTIEIGEPVRVIFQRVGEVSLPRWVRT
jgi:hypothetical protein